VFDHVTIRAADRAVSERFYATVLPTLGRERTHSDEAKAEWDEFSLAQADAVAPVTRNLHLGFRAPSRAHVDAFWRAGVEAGYRDDGAPGPRPQYGDDYYGGFLLDPDGNSAEAVHNDSPSAGGIIDHLWIRVADVAAARRFYAAVAPHAGFRLSADEPDRAQFRGEGGSFSVVAGTPTEHLHMAFPAGYAALVRDPDGNDVELVHHDRP
jgi:catechol 2,3-dioxygenase-like lactoylglutathione lyase family enzyme